MILSIFEQVLIALPLLLGAYLTLSLLKLPDFSVESAYLFGAVTAFLTEGQPIPLILLSAMCGGMFVGLVVSTLNQILHIPFLLAAIVTNGLFHGFTQYLLGTSMSGFHLKLPIDELNLLIMIAITLLLFFVFLIRSELGYSFAIYGNNPHFFENQRLSGRYILFFGVVLGHGCAGISGFLFAQSNGFVDLTMNFGIILLCLTAIMVGKLFMQKARPNLLVPVLGILFFFLIQHSLLRIGLNLKYFNAFQAVFILSILFLRHRKQTLNFDHLGV